MAPSGDDLLSGAVKKALQPVMHLVGADALGGQLDESVYQYFWNGGQGLQQGKMSWQEMVHEYCDNVFSALMQKFSDRAWLNQVDFVLVVDAGIRLTFPPQLIVDVAEEEFQQVVLQAHDRAYEEHRFSIVLWDVVAEHVKEPFAKKKVTEAFEGGRKDSVRELYAAFQAGKFDPMTLDDFAKLWVRNTIMWLSQGFGGVLHSSLDAEALAKIFKALAEVGTLPVPLIAKTGPPVKGWALLDTEVHGCCEQAGLGAWGGGGWSGGWSGGAGWSGGWGGGKRRKT